MHLLEPSKLIQALQTDDFVNGPTREVFLKHGLEGILCLCLQHRRHLVQQKEAIVKVHATAHKMNDDDRDKVVALDNKSCALHLDTIAVLPMEFAVVLNVSMVSKRQAGESY